MRTPSDPLKLVKSSVNLNFPFQELIKFLVDPFHIQQLPVDAKTLQITKPCKNISSFTKFSESFDA